MSLWRCTCKFLSIIDVQTIILVCCNSNCHLKQDDFKLMFHLLLFLLYFDFYFHDFHSIYSMLINLKHIHLIILNITRVVKFILYIDIKNDFVYCVHSMWICVVHLATLSMQILFLLLYADWQRFILHIRLFYIFIYVPYIYKILTH